MDGKKDKRFLLCQIVVATIGLIWIVIKGNYMFLLPYILFMVIAIPTMYFNYILCKWENKWHSRWSERNPCDGEPSNFRLIMGKMSEWALFIVALIIAALPAMTF